MADTVYQVTIGERVLRVKLRRRDTDWLVSVDDGPDQPVQIGAAHGALHWLVVGEERSELLAAAAGETVTLSLGGLEHRAEVVDEARARLTSVGRGRAAGHARTELKAPMPGLLVKVLVQSGDSVQPGQPLAVLQAMKMENELALPRGGTVAEVRAQAGQTVDQGQVLIVVE